MHVHLLFVLRTCHCSKVEVFFSGEKMAEGAGEGQVCIVEYRQENGEEVPTLMLIKEALDIEKF